ncbi:MAG: azurin, partial [Verrucomicrobia bacterium]
MALSAGLSAAAASPPRFTPQPHDHIALTGNALAERMQHFGWLEALLHRHFPEHELVFRNLGYAGDELNMRLRVRDFGSPDEWLTRTRADVVWAFFGFNESFRGEAGLPGFKNELRRYVDH